MDQPSICELNEPGRRGREGDRRGWEGHGQDPLHKEMILAYQFTDIFKGVLIMSTWRNVAINTQATCSELTKCNIISMIGITKLDCSSNSVLLQRQLAPGRDYGPSLSNFSSKAISNHSQNCHRELTYVEAS